MTELVTVVIINGSNELVTPFCYGQLHFCYGCPPTAACSALSQRVLSNGDLCDIVVTAREDAELQSKCELFEIEKAPVLSV